MSKRTSKVFAGGAMGLLVAAVGPTAAGADAGPGWAEYQKMQAELREQRQLIIQLMQSDQQRYELLLKLVHGNAVPGERPPAGGAAAPATAAAQPRASSAAADPSPRVRPESSGTIEGNVRVSGGSAEAVYVYVDVKSPPVKGRTVQIKQEGKQFVPDHVVVQTGTSVLFPNMDPVFHNVFSNSPRNTFDLGTYRTGGPPKAVVMTEAGLVDVQCNIHEQMRAAVLVVPGKLYTRVRPDGTYRIEGVPLGHRRVAAWGPDLVVARRSVDVAPSGARADFALRHTAPRVLPNKLGQPYGSYQE
jgi:plastocyanin